MTFENQKRKMNTNMKTDVDEESEVSLSSKGNMESISHGDEEELSDEEQRGNVPQITGTVTFEQKRG